MYDAKLLIPEKEPLTVNKTDLRVLLLDWFL